MPTASLFAPTTEGEILEDVSEVAMLAHSSVGTWVKTQSLPEADHSIAIIFFERQ